MLRPHSLTPLIVDFAPFRLDLRAGQLYSGTTAVPLRPKSFAVLQYLAERPGELLTKQVLLDAIWGDIAVSEDVVRLSVGEVRKALGDDRMAPRFIETVSRRGYRFNAKMGADGKGAVSRVEPAIDEAAADPTVVGRERERAEIAEWFRAATNGRRQIGFVTGEAGIGKTTLVDTALRDLQRASATPLRIARGQCVEQYGGGEAYLPLVEAIDALRSGPDGAAVEGSLRDHAPEWLLRVIGLQPVSAGSTTSSHEHTLHRLAASLDALAAEIPLVLVLEDVQWSDYSTLDLLSVLAQRRESARLLVVCMLRPADAIVRGHPVTGVKRELLRKGLCHEIPLGGLSQAEVAHYLAARFAGAALSAALLQLLVDRSEGNPFFLVTLVDQLIERRLLVERDKRWMLSEELEKVRAAIPDGLRAVIEPRLERLADDELCVLEAASVTGVEFAAHAVARTAPEGSDLADVEYVEELCDALARRQEILRVTGDSAWPDGTVSARYAFCHALYKQVIYQRLSPSTRRRLHQTIGEALERAYGARTGEVGAELAAHFERSRDVDRAVRYHREAALNAGSRFAYQEARFHLEGALEGMRSQPATPERMRQEMGLLEDLGWTLFALRGFGDEGAARAFARVRDLAELLDAPPVRLRAMDSLLTVHTMRAEYTTARRIGEEMIALAERLVDPRAAASTRPTLGAVLIHQGELESAHAQAERALAVFDSDGASIQAISGRLLLASTSTHLGLIARAREMNLGAVELAGRLGIPYLRAHATNFTATVCQLTRDVPGTRRLAEETLQLATECGFSVFRTTATIYLGWCDVQEGRVAEGLAVTRDALDEYRLSGQRISTSSYTLLLVEAHLANGDVTGANEALDAAFAFLAETGERIYEHELYRLKGECLLASGATRGRKAAAADCFERALALAAERKALLFELRAAVSLCRVRKSARERLAKVAAQFAAEDDCVDLRAAQAFLITGDP